MKLAKKNQKEQSIVDAAESVFDRYGFRNARMDDIAKAAKITKVTLYSYFQSKENLYMAITYRAFLSMTNKYYEAIDAAKGSSGLDVCLGMTVAFMEFCEENRLYADCILEYVSIMGRTSGGQNEIKMTDALVESHYFKKCQEISKLPTQLGVKWVDKGKKDGSITNEDNSLLIFLNGWLLTTGFAKILSISVDGNLPLYDVPIDDLKVRLMRTARQILAPK